MKIKDCYLRLPGSQENLCVRGTHRRATSTFWRPTNLIKDDRVRPPGSVGAGSRGGDGGQSSTAGGGPTAGGLAKPNPAGDGGLGRSGTTNISGRLHAAHGGKEDPHAFIDIFVATAEECAWPEEGWGVHLLPLLAGEAQRAVLSLPALSLPAASRMRFPDLRRAVLDQTGSTSQDHRRWFRAPPVPQVIRVAGPLAPSTDAGSGRCAWGQRIVGSCWGSSSRMRRHAGCSRAKVTSRWWSSLSWSSSWRRSQRGQRPGSATTGHKTWQQQ
ncbi:uncharacterized protein LOC133635984 [Entelurus aequoreus]|uniref:uncharacterized protein LOC133635984 n=1 Tax=Entelurus aequoreus TaxID=161455 RepID=UPI002B1E43AE|nr:uncharacterized protein LOC133635984 [Entelurus aequoreus]